MGAFCKSGAYARKDSCLTTGDLRGVARPKRRATGRRATGAEDHREVSRGHIKGGEGGEPMKPTEGPNAVRLRSTAKVSESGRRPAELACPDPVSVEAIPGALLQQVLARENLQRALKQVRQNKGAPGVDGMSVDELPGYLKRHRVDMWQPQAKV